MSIQIIDGFKLNLSSPIDDRIVASGSTARDNISYKYLGLRVFDLYDNVPYVWRNGISGLKWYKENESALSILPNITFTDSNNIQTSTTKTQFPKLSGNNNVTNSILEETIFKNTGVKVITIGYNTIPTDDSAKLQVNGNVSATSFIGIGKDITSLNGENILNASINVDKISPGTEDFVLVTSGGKVIWEDKNQISKSSQTPFEANSSEDHFIPFKKDASGDLKIGNSFKYNPLNKQLLLSDNLKSSPSISFMNEPNSGIYRRSGNDIGISINSSDKVSIDTNGVKILPGTKTNPGISFIGSNTSGFYYSSSEKKIGFSINANDVLNIVRYDSGSIVLNLNSTSNITNIAADTYYILGNKLNITSNNFTIKTNSADFGLYMENTSTGRGLALRNKNGETIRAVGSEQKNYISFYDGSITSTPTGYGVQADPNWGLRTAWIGNYLDNSTFVINHESTNGKIQHIVAGSVKMETNNNGVKIGNVGSSISKIYTGYIALTTNSNRSNPTWMNNYSMPTGFSTSANSAFGFNSSSSSQASITITHPTMNPKFTIWNICISNEASFNFNFVSRITHSVSSSPTSTTIYFAVPGGWNSLGVGGFAFKFSVMDFSERYGL
jgi:hypothetical protein